MSIIAKEKIIKITFLIEFRDIEQKREVLNDLLKIYFRKS